MSEPLDEPIPVAPPVTGWSGVERSVNRRIFGTIAIVGAVSLVAKVAVVLRDLALARRFGTSEEADAFLLALMVPLFAATVISTSFASAVIPAYISEKDKGGHEATARLLATSQRTAVLLMLGVTALLSALTPVIVPLVAGDLSPEARDLCERTYLILVCAVPFVGMSAIWAGILNAEDRFALPSALPILTPLLPLGLLVLVADPAIEKLALLTVAGYGVELAAMGFLLGRHRLLVVSCRGRWPPAMRQAFGQFLPVFGGSIMMGTAPIIDQAMAATLGAGNVATLSYGTKAVSFGLGVSALAVSTAVLPHYSKLVVAGRWEEAISTLRTWTTYIVAVGLPATLLVVLVARPVVTILFQGGDFTAADSRAVADVLRLSVLQAPFYVVGILVVRLISALRGNRVLFTGAVLSTSANVALNWILMRRIGVNGIALSTTLVYGLSVLYLWRAAMRLLAEAMQEAEEVPDHS